MAQKKICKCGKLVSIEEGLCPKCKAKSEQQIKVRHKDYKARRKDKREQSFYNSSEWILLSEVVKRKYNKLCLYSYYIENKIVSADTTHHIVELKEDWELRFNEDNLIPLSNSAHAKIHSLYRIGKKKETQELLRELLKIWEKDMKDVSDTSE